MVTGKEYGYYKSGKVHSLTVWGDPNVLSVLVLSEKGDTIRYDDLTKSKPKSKK